MLIRRVALLRLFSGAVFAVIPLALFTYLRVSPTAQTSSDREQELLAIIFIWAVFLALHFVDNEKRILGVFCGTLTLYSTSAWLAYHFLGEVYAPFPSGETIYQGTVLSLNAIFATYVVVTALSIFLKPSWREQLSIATRIVVSHVKRADIFWIALCVMFLLGVSAFDWYQVLRIGVGTILASDRRFYWDHLLSTSAHNIQVLAIPISIFVLLTVSFRKSSLFARTFLLASLAGYWVPFVLVGSRKELLVVLIAVFVVFLYSDQISVQKRRLIYSLGVAVVLLMFLMPALADGHFIMSLQEFILPQYFLFALFDYGTSAFEGYNYLNGSLFMLPSLLRPVPVSDLGQTFASLNLTSVGVGSHPVGEAYLNYPNLTVPLFVASTTTLLLSVYLLSKLSPSFAVLGVPYLILWGRSDLWVTLFFLVYGGTALTLLTTTRLGSRYGKYGRDQYAGTLRKARS